MRHILLAPCVMMFGVWLGGCTADPPTTQPASLYERSDKAMKDPFGYAPDMQDTDISGGGTGNLDKPGMRRDVDHVLNP